MCKVGTKPITWHSANYVTISKILWHSAYVDDNSTADMLFFRYNSHKLHKHI